MKKLLSTILAVSMIVANMTFIVAEAAKVSPKYGIGVRNGQNMYRAFLSEDGIPDGMGEWDWFNTNKAAIDLASMKEGVNEEGLWVGSSGVPYDLDLTENGKGADIYSAADLPEDYYSEIKILVAKANDLGNKTNIEYSINDGEIRENYSGDWSDYSAEAIGKVKLWKVEGLGQQVTATEDEGELWEYTITISLENKTKKINKIYQQCKAKWDMIVLGVTGVGLVGTDWIPLIEKEIAAVTGTPTVEKFTEIKSMIEKAKAGGATTDDIDGITGIDTFKSWEMLMLSVKDWKVACNSNEITIDVNFTGAISADSATADNFIVSTGDKITAEPIYADKDIMGVRLTVKNHLNYRDEIKVTVSENVKSADNSSMTLGIDFTFDFTPVAPDIYIESAVVTKTAGSAKANITLQNNANENKPYVLVVCVYDKDGMVKDKKAFGGELAGRWVIPEFDLVAADDDKVEIYLMDSFKDKKLLNIPIVLNDSTDQELMGKLQTPTVCEFYRNKSGAYSLTFDDGDYNSNVFYSSVLGKYGFKGTAMIIADKINTSIANWQELLADGNIDIGNHSATHDDVSYLVEDLDKDLWDKDINGAYNTLHEYFPEQDILTFATPYGGKSEAAIGIIGEKHYANRLAEGETPNSANPTNWMTLNSYVYGFAGKTAEEMNAWADDAVDENGWSIALLHGCIDGDEGVDLAIGKEIFEKHLEYLNTKNELWVASFNDVTAYLREKQSASISIVSANEDRMILSVTDTLPDDRFHQPLTLEVNVPDSWTKGARFSQGETQGESIVTSKNGKIYVQIDAVPDNGHITLYRK